MSLTMPQEEAAPGYGKQISAYWHKQIDERSIVQDIRIS